MEIRQMCLFKYVFHKFNDSGTVYDNNEHVKQKNFSNQWSGQQNLGK